MLFLRTISGIILGFAPIALGLLFGILFYDYQTNNYGIVGLCALTILGILLGYKIFKLVRKIGFISFITAINSTQHISKQSQDDEEVI